MTCVVRFGYTYKLIGPDQLVWLARRTCHKNSVNRFNAIVKRKGKGSTAGVSSFVDAKDIEVHGGKGGDGCISMSQIANNPNDGPDGGDGGHGGHVFFEANFNVKSLVHLPSVVKGFNGISGQSRNCHGKNAEPLVVQVPYGTMFKGEDGKIMADMSSVHQPYFLAAKGGAGGRGNRFFTTSENQSPEICEFGGEGEKIKYHVEMSTIAHVGLVGYPNAGKSTFLQAITRARPKVASYPFTTLRPYVGMLLYEDMEQIAVADIPGIIEDAHLNRGLGYAFLRHIQRCLCLVYVVDLSSSDPSRDLQVLYDEIEHYDSSMLTRPSIVLANKMDLPEAQQNYNEFREALNNDSILFPVSTKMGINLKPVLAKIREMYEVEIDKLMKKYMEVKNRELPTAWKRSTDEDVK